MIRPTLRRAAALSAVVVAAGSLGACRGDSAGYQLTATFERTIGLYEGGDVHVMGIAVGSVDDIEVDGTLVRVEMTIDDDVILPEDLWATVGQTQLIGERNVVLYPPWDAQREASGAARASDGDVIPRERTVAPVEPDESLAAFDELARGLDGDVVGQLVHDAARVLDGRGEQIGTAIDQAAGLSTTLAEVDQQLVGVAENLHVLAGSLAARGEQLAGLVDAFSEATEVLAAEREGIRAFLTSMVELTEQGGELLTIYGDQLPSDVASATALASILARNTESIDQLLTAFPLLAEGFAAAYQPSIDGLYLRAHLSPSVRALLSIFTDQLSVLP